VSARRRLPTAKHALTDADRGSPKLARAEGLSRLLQSAGEGSPEGEPQFVEPEELVGILQQLSGIEDREELKAQAAHLASILDTDGDGRVSLREVRALQALGLQRTEEGRPLPDALTGEQLATIKSLFDVVR
jgi:hypothetical protein